MKTSQILNTIKMTSEGESITVGKSSTSLNSAMGDNFYNSSKARQMMRYIASFSDKTSTVLTNDDDDDSDKDQPKKNDIAQEDPDECLVLSGFKGCSGVAEHGLESNKHWLQAVSQLISDTLVAQGASVADCERLGDDIELSLMYLDPHAIKQQVVIKIVKGDHDFAQFIFQAMDEPLYPRNRNMVAEDYIEDFITFIKTSVDGSELKMAILNNLPDEV